VSSNTRHVASTWNGPDPTPAIPGNRSDFLSTLVFASVRFNVTSHSHDSLAPLCARDQSPQSNPPARLGILFAGLGPIRGYGYVGRNRPIDRRLPWTCISAMHCSPDVCVCSVYANLSSTFVFPHELSLRSRCNQSSRHSCASRSLDVAHQPIAIPVPDLPSVDRDVPPRLARPMTSSRSQSLPKS